MASGLPREVEAFLSREVADEVIRASQAVTWADAERHYRRAADLARAAVILSEDTATGQNELSRFAESVASARVRP